MSEKAAFTLSLDCEGLWGVADQPSVISGHIINQSTLTNAYAFIRETLNACQLKASLAFVTSFAAGKEVLSEELPIIREMASLAPSWFINMLPLFERGEFDGWDGSNFYSQLEADGHEMAWHGTTHLPLIDSTPAIAIDLELKLARRIYHNLGKQPRSIVFPRNRIGHLQRLSDFGFKTYRNSQDKNVVVRAADFLSEWSIFDSRVHAKPSVRNGWCVTPAGFFLNWPSGPRACIPTSVTVARWKSLLRSAVASGGYVHMWFHPHNFITAPSMKAAFSSVMSEVAKLSRSGELAVLTMDEANQHFSRVSFGKNSDISY